MNTIVTITGGQAATTTLAIAEGTEVEHKAVIQLVRTYQADLEEFGGVAFEMAPFETAGGMQKREYAILNEQQSTLILTYMRNSEIVRTFKKRLVKAFWELAQQAKSAPALNPANLSRLQLIEMAMQAEQERLVLEAKVAEQAPKVEALDRIATASEGSFCIRDAAKTLQVQEKRLKQLLIERKWIYRRPMGAGLLAYSERLQQGVMEHKMTRGEKNDGSEWTDTQARITAKGIARLSEILTGEGVPA